MPLYAGGGSKSKALAVGVLSGIVEPLGAVTALIAAKAVGAMLPYFLSFAAGAMLFVVSGQMLGEIKYRGRFPLTGVAFTLGFMIMMSLDVALG
ncbi:MAG: ZIP family metal transporter, partial [Clostridia bacterium]|nr:ZIP family metal transporter [Clostridia bacterium]